PDGSMSERDGAEKTSLPDSSRSRRRRTPFAQISGGSGSVGPIDIDDPAAEFEPRVRPRGRSKRPEGQLDDELDRQAFHRASQSWMRVAGGWDDSMIQIR